MDIRVLGSVEVWAGTGPVAVGGSKPRALLAALALESGRVVSVSRLVEVLWGTELPATATDLVQTYVSSLRRKLPADGAVIETRPPGYLLRSPPDAIDHQRFQRLVAEARAERDRGAAAGAAELFDAALALWRGPALSGLGRSALAVDAARLDELRLVVLEERAAIGLALGNYEALVHELTATVRSHPAREVLRRHLMVALYALDRQADALAVYREGRRFLVDEHGVEPGPALRAAHEAILRSDPAALGVPQRSIESRTVPPPVTAIPVPRPAQLPAVPPDFTGRGRQLKEVTGGLAAASAMNAVPVRVISGQGGVGKSTLALRAAHELADDYPDGQLFAQLHGTTDTPASTEAVLARFLKALGDPAPGIPSTVEEQGERYRSVLAGRRVLVVLDKQDRLAEARTYLMQALQVFRDLGDVRGEAVTLAALATANHEQGYLSEALHFFELAEAIFHELGDEAASAYSDRLVGLVKLERGDLVEARQVVTRALEAFRRLGSRRGEGLATRTLSLVHRAQGAYQRAHDFAEQARMIFQETGDELLEAYSARSAAKALVRLGRGEETGVALERALATSRALGDRWGEAMTLRTLGERDLAAGRLPEAEQRLRAAIRLWQAIDLPLHQARTQRDLAATLAAAGDEAGAARLWAEMIEVFRVYGVRELAEVTA